MSPAAASGPKGDFVAAWSDSARGIQAKRHDASGNPIVAEFLVTSEGSLPAVAEARNSRFVVTWNGDGSGPDNRAQPFDANGMRSGRKIVVNAYTTGSQTSFPIAAEGSTAPSRM